jgi:predicted ATPase
MVFIFPPWREIYRHDEERKHSFAHAEWVFEACEAVYRACGYELVEVPRRPVEARADFILAHAENVTRGLPPGKG